MSVNTVQYYTVYRNKLLHSEALSPEVYEETVHVVHGPVLLASTAKLGIGQERGTRDKPSQ
jgi:hypothetical protein